MITPAIRTSGLVKRYDVYGHPLDILLETITRRPRHKEFVALNGVDLEIRRGEVVGIIGRNGAGKSTLLKLIAGTVAPTSGLVEVNGRVSAILELGAGFNPDQTGLDNIIMGGLCLGLSRAEIERRLDDIIEFSELRPFIDQQLKTYSSGMYARLAFAVATAVAPDILIVDEALSVGDAKFQRRCFSRFEEFRDQGRTILFVTHQAALVELICDRAIYLEKGRVKSVGTPKEVMDLYNRDLFGPAGNPLLSSTRNSSAELRYGNGAAEILSYALLDENREDVRETVTGRRYTIQCRLRCNRETVDDLNVGVSITTKEGVRLFAVNPIVMQCRPPVLTGGDLLDVEVDLTMNFGIGDYFVTLGAWGIHEDTHYDRRVDAIHFRVFGDPMYSRSLVNCAPEYRMKAVAAAEGSGYA